MHQFVKKLFNPAIHTFESRQIEVSWCHEQLYAQRVLAIKQLKAVLSTTGQLFLTFLPFCMDNSKNPLLLFVTRVVERSDTVKVPFLDTLKKFIEFLSQPHCQATTAMAIPQVCIRHSHVIYYELLIVDE